MGLNHKNSWKRTLSAIFPCLIIALLMSVVLSGTAHAQSADEYFSRAVNQYVDGNDRAALSILEQALEQDPDHQNALQLKKQIGNSLPDDATSGQNDSSEQNGFETDSDLQQRQSGDVDGGPSPGTQSEDDTESQEPTQTPSPTTNNDNNQNQTSTSTTEGGDSPGMDPENTSQATQRRQDTAGFQPLPASKRREESPEPPAMSNSAKEMVEHVNEDYETPSGRRTESVYGVTARHYEDRVRYVIKASGTVDFIVSQIYQPPMLIVDLPNAVDQLPDSPLEIGFPNNIRVRHSQYRIKPMNVTRVVIDMEQWTDNYRVYRDSPGNRIIVDVYKSDEAMAQDVDQTMTDAGTGRAPDTADETAGPIQETDRQPGVQFETFRGRDQVIDPTVSAPEPLVVSLTDENGDPISGVDVMFDVTSGDGRIDAAPDRNGYQDQTTTNDSGIARAEFTAGQTAGPQIIEAYVPEHDAMIQFRVQVEPGEPTRLVKVRGDEQEAMFGRPVDVPPTVRVLDRYGNPVPDVRVEFSDRSGQGFVDVDREQDGIQRSGETNDDGELALDVYRLPTNKTNNRVTATVRRPGQDNLQASFNIYGHAQLLSIDFKNANLQDVLRTLAEIAQWNIVLADEVQGQPVREMSVSVHLSDVTALKALDTILDVKGLSRVSDGNVMKIVPKPQALRKGVPVLSPEELSEYQGNNMVTVTYQLTYLTANSELSGRLQEALMAENSSIVADQNSNSLTITDLANNQKRIREILENIDKPNQQFEVAVIPLEYKNAQDFQQQLVSLLPLGQQATIQHNPRSNALMVYGEETLIQRVKKLAEMLDKPGQLRDNFTFVDMTGYDESQIANKVNGILGLQVIPLEQVTGLEFDFESPEDALSVIQQSSQLNIQQLLNTANVIPLPRLNKILIFGPKDVQEAAVKLIDRLKESKENYVQNRQYRWYQAKNLSLDRLNELIGQIGNVQIESEIRISRAFLLASPDQESLNNAIEFLERVDGADLGSSREVIVYSPQFVDPTTLGDDIQTYYEDLQSAQQPPGGGQQGEVMPRILHSGEQRIVFVVNSSDEAFLMDLLNKLDSNLYDEQTVLTYFPQYVSAQTLQTEISNQNIGRLIYFDENRVSLIVPEEQEQQIRQMLEKVDTSGHTTEVVYLKHTRASEMLSSLNSIQQDMDLNVSFSADQSTNSIIFSAPKTSITRIRSIISRLDRWQKQVFIEGIILEYTLTEGQQFRYQWFLNPDGNQVNNADAVPSGEAGGQFGNINALGGQGVAGTFTAILNQQNFQSVLSVLANESQSEVLAKPQITAINNEQASIRVGDEQQIQVQRQTEEGVVSSLQAVSAFTELQVTPTITKNRHVLMDITISSDQFTTPQAANIQTQITRRTTENSVLVQDGQTVVIGGLIEEESTSSEQGIPYLKDVPFAGNLFESNSESTDKRELIIFLTPHVIESPAESRRQAQQVSDDLTQITPLGVNINIATQSELARIQGLSPEGNEEQRVRLAQRIVRYREQRGPFRNFRELLDVPGINQDILNNIIYRLELPVDLNTVSVDDLIKIRNINYEIAQALIEARQRQGTFQSMQRPRQIILDHGISSRYYRRYLEPILTVTGINQAPNDGARNGGANRPSDSNSREDTGTPQEPSSSPQLRGTPQDQNQSGENDSSLPTMDDISGD
jgi:type II secretory pathway component GspD/PulD (secretin)